MDINLPPLHEVIPALDLEAFKFPCILERFQAFEPLSNETDTTQSISDTPFYQVVPGDPLVRLQADQVWSAWSTRVTGRTNAPTPLGTLDLESLQANHVLFTFGVICIMARLNPRFEFKYGGANGKLIGLRLTFYGGIVVVDPLSDSAYSSKVVACRKAMWKLREFNPHWLCPPLPSDGPTGAEWDWIRLLEEYCILNGISQPLYSPTFWGKQWHCDLSLNGCVFRTASPSATTGQAENTVAHLALHGLITIEEISDVILQASEPPVVIKKETKGRKPRVRSTALGRINACFASLKRQTLDNAIETTITDPGKVISDSGRRFKRIKPNPRAVVVSTKAKKSDLGNANLTPCTNSRVAALEEKPEVQVDPLATLKAIQKELEASPKDSSYNSLLNRICYVLMANVPEIRHERYPDESVPSGWMVRAWFDMSHPYLSRASPIMLATLPKTEEKVALSLGVRKMILYLLDMAKEDAGLGASSESQEYDSSLPLLKALEVEIEDRIHADANLY